MAPRASISIRKCLAGDEVALSLVGQASFLEAFAGIIHGDDILGHCFKQHSAEKYAEWIRDPGSIVWLAEVQPGSAPVGYLVMTKPDLPLRDISPADLEVKRIYLLHRFQGSGLGARLMREAEINARVKGARRLLLGVYAKNEAAVGFYEKLGYRKIGTRVFKVGDHHYDDFILGLTL